MRRQVKLAVLGALLAVALSACGNDAASDAPAVAEPVTAEQVQTIAENMLAAYNSGTTAPSAEICRCSRS